MLILVLFIILFIEFHSFLLKAEELPNILVNNITTSNNIIFCKNNALDNKNLFTIYNKNYIFPNIYKEEKIDLELFDIYKEYSKDDIIIEPMTFINENTNLNFIVNVKKVYFKDLCFNIENNNILNLKFLLNGNMKVEGKPILIKGDEENSKAIITMCNFNNKTHKSKLELYAIHSEIPTALNIDNIDLYIKKDIQFIEDNTQVNINRSLIHGNIHVRGIENMLIANNAIFENCKFHFYNEKNKFVLKDVISENSNYEFKAKDNTLKFNNIIFNNSRVVLYSVGNNIEIMGDFKGNITSLNNNSTLHFNKAKIKNSEITLNNNNILNFDGTTILNSSFSFKGNGNNFISFNNTNNESNFNFNNSGINSLEFKGNSINCMSGTINIENNTTLNFKFMSNSKNELSMLINGYINEFHINSFSELIFKNKETIKINKFICHGSNTISIDLNNSEKFYLYIKELQFNKDTKVNLKVYNINKLFSSESDEVVYKLLKSETNLDKSLDIKLCSNLSYYNIMIQDKEIILVLKKTKRNIIHELVKRYYKYEDSIFYKDDLLSLAEYLDKLKDIGTCSKVGPILDYIDNINLTNNSKELINLVSHLLPVSNNILYRASYDTSLSFLDELNSTKHNERLHETNIWSSIYHLKNNFILGNSKTTNINLTGNAVATGVIYPVNNYFDIGVSIGGYYNNINNYNYNINLFALNLATHSKVFITNKLCNFSTLSLNLQNFNTQRNVIMYNYDNINYSYPVVKNFIFYNVFSYSLDVLQCKRIIFNVKPNIKFAFGKILLSDYNETGTESLFIKGFNVFTNTTELNINYLVGIKLEKAHLKTNVSLGGGYEYNNLPSTIFKFTDDNSNYYAKLKDYNNKHPYLKLDIGLAYTPLNQLYDINLLYSYKNSKINSNTRISIMLSFKF